MKSNIPYVAIVGRPNVGKSTLFNRLIQKKLSIVSPIEGTTRDRLINECTWLGRSFYLIDTGGFSNNKKLSFQEEINKQVEIALSYADVIVFMVSSEDGLLKEDLVVASKIKKYKDKKIILVANKSDNKNLTISADQFYELGLGKPLAISSIHGINTSHLLDDIVTSIAKDRGSSSSKIPRIGIVGKPNVGKSSLLNCVLNDDRVIVSAIPGTTRDAIDTFFTFKEKEYILTDTAGIKKNKASLSDIEYYSELRSELTIQNSDILLLVIDPKQTITHIDETLLAILKQDLKPAIIIVNKIDLISDAERKEMEKQLQEKFAFASFASIMFVSALKKRNINKIFEEVERIHRRLSEDIASQKLNQFLREIQMIKMPPRHLGELVILHSMEFENKRYPHFIITCSKPELVHFSYKRFIENQIRNVFDFKSIPIRISYKHIIKGNE